MGARKNNRLSGQHDISWIGVVADTVFNTLPILSIYTYVSLTIILYTSIKPYLTQWGYPWVTWWMFFLAMVLPVIILLMGVYKFLLLPLWRFRAKQMFRLEDDVLKEIRNELVKINRKLEASSERPDGATAGTERATSNKKGHQ